ncbi:hypothetical protein [Streptomyces spinosirectus]
MSECPLCPEYGTSLLDPCPGHPVNDNTRDAIDTARLHAERRHPGYEYRTTQGPRKQWDTIDQPPYDDDGEPDPSWERNVDAGRPGQGWDRFDYTEESYWRRRKPSGITVEDLTGRETDAACAVLHTDAEGNTIPCPGYPHAEGIPKAAPRASVIELIAPDYQPTEEGMGSIIVPRQLRINGTSVYVAKDTPVTVSPVRLGDNLITVNVTLIARSVVIAADGDLGEAR